MPNLKDLRSRIKSVQSTKKITSAMKMISAAKLKKAQGAAEAARPYADEMAHMLSDLIQRLETKSAAPRLLAGTGTTRRHLLIVITSNRGLCGGFNTSVAREAKRMIRELKSNGKDVKLVLVGRKGYDLLRTEFKNIIIGKHLSITNPHFYNAESIVEDVLSRFEKDEFDVCTAIYNKFLSALSQEVTTQRLIPFQEARSAAGAANDDKASEAVSVGGSIYVYEPSQEAVLHNLLPRNIKVQVFRALLESTASEHGARMAAMDGATRNANEMIGDLNLTYNRTRQAYITSELIEIISGAEAL